MNDFERVRAYLTDLQDRICAAIETADGRAHFIEEAWTRTPATSGGSGLAGGGGRTRRTRLIALFSLAVRNLILSGLLFAGLSGLLPVVIATLTVTVLTYLLSRIWVFA